MSLCALAKAVDDKKEAARKAALEVADKKAFAENMAAYKDEVRPFLEKHCIGCHGPKKLKGDLALDLLDPDMKESTSAARWAVVRDQLENGDMPPDDKPPPPPEQSDKVLAWIKAEMRRSRRNFSERMQQISGNKVQHDLLFDSNQAARLMIAPRIRRHSVELYETFRKEQLSATAAASRTLLCLSFSMTGSPLTSTSRKPVAYWWGLAKAALSRTLAGAKTTTSAA